MRYIIIFLLLSSCMTTEKATDYLKKKGDLSKVCLETFPPEIKYKEGQTITKRDTLALPGDSIPCPPVFNGKDTIIKYAKCPEQKQVTNTIHRVDTVEIEITARVDSITQAYNKLETAYINQGADLKASKTNKWYFLVAGLVFGALITLYIKR